MAAAVRVRGNLEWSEEVLRRAEAEVGREDTDDRVGAAVEPDTPAEHQGVAGEAIAPESVREHGHLRLPGRFLDRPERAAEGGLDAQEREEIGAHPEAAHPLGPALIRYRAGDEVRDVHVPPGRAYRFTIPPGIAHAIQNTGQERMVLVAFNSVVHDPECPDVVRDVLIAP